MNNKKQVQEWVTSGIINQEQAEKILTDVESQSADDKSSKLIVTISIIGAILLGVGTILFVASNWEEMPDSLKVAILLLSTFGTYYLGYLFKYHKKNLPKIGAVLLFLASLLFGTSIFLIAQIYNINANNHVLVLAWLAGILPLVYAFKSPPIAALSAILFYLWIGLFIFRNIFFDNELLVLFPLIYLSAGTLLFSLGGLHFFNPFLKKVGKIFRLLGLKIAMLSLFLLTFEIFSGQIDEPYLGDYRLPENLSPQLLTGVILFSVVAILGLCTNILFKPTKSKTNLVENGMALGLVILALLFLFYPASTSIYTLLFNLVFIGLTLLLIFLGYQKNSIQMVNISLFWISAFILARYFDFLWALMPKSLFFMVGGIILILGGAAMEQKRKQLKESFTKSNT